MSSEGCQHGPETRECYFEPLTQCKVSDADPISDTTKAFALKTPNDEYDRSIRTLYTAQDPWWRSTKDQYAWTKLPGRLHSEISMLSALFAYYFNPRPWLRDEIDKRLQASIPADLDPNQTVGVILRRSDKCRGHNIKGSAAGEMNCKPISAYLEGVQTFVEFDPSIKNVIVTSEDKSACDEFMEMLKKELPKLRIIQNVGDVQQGTGSGSKLESYTEGSSNSAVVAR